MLEAIKKIDPIGWIGMAMLAVALVMAAVMGYFPKGFVEPAMTPESFLVSTPYAHAVAMYVAAYAVIAMAAIGGALMIRREMFIARIKN